MSDTTNNINDKIALMMSMGGASNTEEAAQALEEGGGSVDRALSQLHDDNVARYPTGCGSCQYEEGVGDSTAKPVVELQEHSTEPDTVEAGQGKHDSHDSHTACPAMAPTLTPQQQIVRESLIL